MHEPTAARKFKWLIVLFGYYIETAGTVGSLHWEIAE